MKFDYFATVSTSKKTFAHQLYVLRVQKAQSNLHVINVCGTIEGILRYVP